MVRGQVVALRATDPVFAPRRRIGVGGGVVIFLVVGEVAMRAHRVPVHAAPAPVSPFARLAAFVAEHIEPFFLNHFEMRDIDIWNDSLINKKTTYINRTTESDFQLRNIMNSYQQDLEGILKTFSQPNENKNHQLIALLKKEYHLK